MKPFQFLRKNLIYFWKKNLSLSTGIAISAAVITGSLIVGDSVKSSLEKVVEHRLGKITHVVKSGDRFFSYELTGKLSDDLNIPASAALSTRGIAVAGGGKIRLGNIQVLGVDKDFDYMMGLDNYYSEISDDEVVISSNLASRLGLKQGDEFVLRMVKTSLIPLNAPFVSDADNEVSVRLQIKAVSDIDHGGMFNLKKSQTAPFNAFLSYDALCELMNFKNKANLIFLNSEKELSESLVIGSIKKNWELADVGLKLEKSNNSSTYDIKSDRVFIDDVTASSLVNIKTRGEAVITYFVNSIKSGNYSTPYSFVSTMDTDEIKDNEVIINSWLAEDLNVKKGDSLSMDYFVVGPLRELNVETESFIIKKIVPMTGRYADSGLMPDLPGLSDAGNCREWETGVPIKLDEIRDKDEAYWNLWKGTPKAFISLSKATKMWSNRFGSYTGFKFESTDLSEKALSSEILNSLQPSGLGFQIDNVKTDGEIAARSGVDFSQLFAGLSFFLLAGAILLTVLLFMLNLSGRKEQLKTLFSLGISVRLIRRMTLAEGLLIALIGAALGLVLAVVYTRLIFLALNGIWHDIVRTNVLIIDIRLSSLILGFVITLFITYLTLTFTLKSYLKYNFKSVEKKNSKQFIIRQRYWIGILALLSGLSGIAIILFQLMNGEKINESYFFMAGSLLLLSGISGFQYILKKTGSVSYRNLSIGRLGRKNIFRNPGRSLTIVILFALGSFLVVSTGSNRKDLFKAANQKSSGTGGFLYFAESTLPVLRDLNQQAVRNEYALSHDYNFVQLRLLDGDDASCLNLNKIANPAILGVKPELLSGRFSFASDSSFLDENDPWLSLNKDLPSGLVPGIADETVIKWGLGLKVGDTLKYTNGKGDNLDILLIGGTAPSIFQGRVIISEKHFLKEFPESSGTSVFLIDGNIEDTATIVQETSMGLRDLGWDMELCSVRLTEFNSITNTYLSVFMVLGALGLLLGTIGLAIILTRSIQERKQEIAILRALGFSKPKIRKHIVVEYMILLITGTCIGILSSAISTLPSILSKNTGASFDIILFILIILILNGWAWTYGMAVQFLRNKKIYKSLRNE
jgi:putative ABC transport system permease protein